MFSGRCREVFLNTNVLVSAFASRGVCADLLEVVLLEHDLVVDSFIAATAQGMKEGAKMPRADWKQMRAYPVQVPNPRVLSAFNGVVEPVLQQLKSLALQSRKLRAARDLLLPRLMSGELTV